MLTKKQRWRRVRVVRSNSNSSISSSDSSGGGSGISSDFRTAPQGFASFSAMASSGTGSSLNDSSRRRRSNSSSRSNSSGSGSHSSGSDSSGSNSSGSNSNALTPWRRPPVLSSTAGATASQGSSDNTSPPPPPPPPPLPLPQQHIPPPLHDISPDLGSNHAVGAQTTEPPTAFAGGERQQQQQQQQHNGSSIPAGNAPGSPHHKHYLEAWRVSALNLLKCMFFSDASGGVEDGHTRHHTGDFGGWGGSGGGGGGGNRDRSATEGCHSFAPAAAAARPRRPSEPACRPPSPLPKAVRFSHQIRVILVASRVELSAMRADIWWGERDYCDFRRAYLKAAREKIESDQEVALQKRGEPGIPGQESQVLHRPDSPVSADSTVMTSTANSAGSADCAVVAAVPALRSPCSSKRATSPKQAIATVVPRRKGRDDGDDKPLSKPSDGEDDGYDGGDDGDSEGSRRPQVAPPNPPPPSPESQPRAERHGAATGMVNVKRLSGVLGDQRVSMAQDREEGGGTGGGTATPLDVDNFCAKDKGGPAAATATTSAVVGAEAAAPAADFRGDAVTSRHGQISPPQSEGDGEEAVPVDPAIDVPKGSKPPPRGVGSSVDIASLARGFRRREAGPRTGAAMAAAERSPGSSAVAAASAAALASSLGGGESRGELWREETTLMLELRRDLRIDPRTGGRMPLPFLGETRIRRVASF